jgi:hypothetical protein
MRRTTKIATRIYERERTRQLIKLAVGAGAYSSSPVWGGKGTSPASNPAAVSSGPKNTISPIPAAVPKALNTAGKAIWDNGGQTAWNNGGKQLVNTGLNTMSGISTTGIGATNAAAGAIGGGAARLGRIGTGLTDATGLTTGATDWLNNNVTRHMDNAAIAGVKDVVGGVADTASGGYYDYDGSLADPGQHKGTAVQQQRSGIRDELGRGTDLDTAFQRATGVSNAASDMVAYGGFGRGLNVAAKAVQGSQTAAPVLGAVARAPVVGKPLAAAGKWLAGEAPAANMFTKTPVEYYRAAVTGGGGTAVANSADDVARNVLGVGQQLGDDVLNVTGNINPADAPADYAATQQQNAQELDNAKAHYGELFYGAAAAGVDDHFNSRIQGLLDQNASPQEVNRVFDEYLQHTDKNMPTDAYAQMRQPIDQVRSNVLNTIAQQGGAAQTGGQFNVPDQGQPQPGAAEPTAPEAPKSWMQQAGDQVSQGWESLTKQFMPADAKPEDHAAAAQAADTVKETAAAAPPGAVNAALQNPEGEEAQQLSGQRKPQFEQQAQEEYAAAVPPPTTGNPQDYGKWMADMGTHIDNSWKAMGGMGQLAFSLGVPMALIGMMSGNIGGFLMGALGLGAAGFAGASGGMFGPDAQRGLGHMIDYGAQALGMNVPQGPKDMSQLIGEDAVGNLQKQISTEAKPGFLDMFNIATDPEARAKKQETLKTQLADVDSVQQLAGMPASMAIPFIMAKHQGPDGQQASPEVARQIYQNALATSQQLSDPESEMAKQVATGRQYAADPDAYINAQVQPYKDKAVELAKMTDIGRAADLGMRGANWAYDKYQNWGK